MNFHCLHFTVYIWQTNKNISPSNSLPAPRPTTVPSSFGSQRALVKALETTVRMVKVEVMV